MFPHAIDGRIWTGIEKIHVHYAFCARNRESNLDFDHSRLLCWVSFHSLRSKCMLKLAEKFGYWHTFDALLSEIVLQIARTSNMIVDRMSAAITNLLLLCQGMIETLLLRGLRILSLY